MTTFPIRLGVVGLGAVAQLVYVPLLAQRRDLFAVTAITDLSARLREHQGERLGVPDSGRFAEVADMLDSGLVDAVLVLSSGSHADVAGLIAGRGLPVLVEKPLAWTHAELDELETIDRGLIQVGYMKRFDPAVTALQTMLAEAEPAIRSVEVLVLHPSDARQVLFHRGGLRHADDVSASRRAQLAAHGTQLETAALGAAAAARLGWIYSDVLLGSLIHDLAVIRGLTGDPERVRAARLWPASATPDRLSVAAEAQLPDGAELSMRWHYLADYPAYREEVRIHTETGSYELIFPAPYLLHAPTALRISTAVGEDARTVIQTGYAESFELQLEAFARTAARMDKPSIGIEEARADVRTCQRIAARLAEATGLPADGEMAVRQ